MGRRSHGNTYNESKKMVNGEDLDKLSLKKEKAKKVERLRNTPGVSRTPSTFAEAASLAKEKMRLRELSSKILPRNGSPNMKALDKDVVPKNILADLEIQDCALTDSSCSPVKLCDLSLSSAISSTESSISKVDSSVEGEISKKMLSLTIDLNLSADSFSSSPETARNKGAIAFLELLEENLARQTADEEAVQFEQLIVQMMDLDVASKIPTPDQIAPRLIDNGWNLAQVSSVWSVSASAPSNQDWNFSSLEQLGGKGTVSRIWDHLKSNHLTGFPKRPSEDSDVGPGKRQRLCLETNKVSSNCSLGCSPSALSLMEQSKDKPQQDKVSKISCSGKSTRRKLQAARSKPALSSKITWWFGKQEAEGRQDTPSRSKTPSSMPQTPEIIPPTPSPAARETFPKKTMCKRKRRGRKQKSAVETPSDPSNIPTPPLTSSTDPLCCSPPLQKRFPASNPFLKTPKPVLSSPARAKKTSGCSSKAVQGAAPSLIMDDVDRKQNVPGVSTTEERRD